jgi:glycosyltransferase involved in cell wall biosynthesis
MVVISHLRWEGVWQRPQQLISRLASRHQRIWFIEEPVDADVDEPCVEAQDFLGGALVRLRVARRPRGVWPSFRELEEDDTLAELLTASCAVERPLLWLYTPLGLPLGRRLAPQQIVYDVMDDLASFRGAAEPMRLRHLQTLTEADVVFTGGRSLHRSVLQHRRGQGITTCFPSGVDADHFAEASSARAPSRRPQVAAYVGVIDERLDLELVARLARALPDWRIRMVGPVTKIEDAKLPRVENLEYLGRREYQELPGVLADADVGIMPFALNDSTRSISPTKSLEYLAAGLPVVSTRVPDVVADLSGIAALADDALGFAEACRAVAGTEPSPRAVELLASRAWTAIAASMASLIDEKQSALEPDEDIA